jgi:hypothetical protein
VRWLAPIGGVCLSGAEGAWARGGGGGAGPAGLTWAEMVFSIFQGISNWFSIYFL